MSRKCLVRTSGSDWHVRGASISFLNACVFNWTLIFVDARDHDTVPGAAIGRVFKYLKDKLDEYEKSEEEEHESKEDEESQGDLETPKEDDDKDTGKQGATNSEETEPSQKDSADSTKTDRDEPAGDRILETQNDGAKRIRLQK